MKAMSEPGISRMSSGHSRWRTHGHGRPGQTLGPVQRYAMDGGTKGIKK